MQVWADVYDAHGARLGDGPVRLVRAQVRAVLDGVGSVALEAPADDRRAAALIVAERRVRLWTVDEGGAPVLLGGGVVRAVRVVQQAGGHRLTADGPDALDLLKRRSVLLGRAYNQQTYTAVVGALVGLVPGWAADVSAAGLVSARFDGVSVLRALQLLAEHTGMHLRLGTDAATLAFGPFGAASGVRVAGAGAGTDPRALAPDARLIQQLSLLHDSEAACNWVLPLMAGMGESAAGLEWATKTGVYPTVMVTGPDGRARLALYDPASVAALGELQQVAVFKQIAPLTNSRSALEVAGNSLYDAAAAHLTRHKDPQTVVRAVVRGAVAARPGDTVRLVWQGVVHHDGVPHTLRAFDADMVVLEHEARADGDGLSTTLTLSNVARLVQDSATIVLGRLEQISLERTRVEPFFNHSPYVYRREIDATHPAVIPLRIDDAVQRVVRVTVGLKTRAFRATSKASAPGVITSTTASSSVPAIVGRSRAASTDAFTWRAFDVASDGGDASGSDVRQVLLPVNGPESDLLFWRISASNHTHQVTIDDLTIDYGIEDDTQRPAGVRLAVNGADVTGALGGPWGAGGQPVDVVLDVTPWIEGAPGGIQREHTLTVTCDGGQGEVEGTLSVYTIIQAIRV